MNKNTLTYWAVLGPGRKLIANFKEEEEAIEFRSRVVVARLEQLERIKPVLTLGEYNGEYNFRKNGITVKEIVVPMMTNNDMEGLKDEDLVDGNFLIIGDRRNQ